jgi:hypothetical protein
LRYRLLIIGEITPLFVAGETAILVGSNHQRLVTVKYNPSDIPSFHLLKGSEAQQWTQRVRVNVGSEGSGAELRRRIYLDPKPFKPVSFGPEDHFTLVQENKATYEPQQKRLLVMEQIGNTVKRYRLPRSTYEEFARARPTSVKNGLTWQVTTIDEEIGAWQIVDRVPWFGKSFYDGEGNTGVGGFGYFDIEQRKYRMYSPPEILDWSVSAMLVQPNTVWLALAHRGEYGDSSGGLLRFNRATQTVERLALPDIATDIAYVGDHVLLATESGAAVVEAKKLRMFFVDEATNGQLQVVEAKLGVDVP